MAARGLLTWVNPTQNTDGTAYNAATENAGYDVALDGTEPTVSLPFAFGTSFDLSTTQAWDDLLSGSHNVRLRVVTKEGTMSDWTAPISFLKAGTPNTPTALTVV